MELQHGRITIQLRELSQGKATRSADSRPASDTPPLLLLHALGSSAADWGDRWDHPQDEHPLWDGPVYALDFVGHGQSEHISARCYYPEIFLMDADRALEAIGDRAYLAGAGVGAYVAMLLAGSRPDRVPAALLLPGRGLASGGPMPDFDRSPESIEAWEARILELASAYADSTDPFVATCEQDVRPTDYVSEFAQAARRLLFSEAVAPTASGDDSLAWWSAARESSGAADAPAELAAALRQLAP